MNMITLGSELYVLKYISDPIVAILVEDVFGAPFLRLTVNVPGIKLKENEVVVKTYSENAPYRDALLNSGYFTDTRMRINTGHTFLEIWRINASLRR